MNKIVTGRICIFLLAILLCLSSLSFIGCKRTVDYEIQITSSPETATTYPEIDEYITRQMADEDVPGLAVVVVQGDEIIYLKGFGVTSLNNPSPVTPRTIFDLASISKSFTALGVLLLRDKGLIDLDTPVQQYLTDFQLDDPRAADITVRQLLNQTSGLPGNFSAPLIFQHGEDEFKEVISAINHIKLNRDPGSSFEYADVNYCLLGALIEQVTGTTFEDYMQHSIFKPLGMDNTTLYPEEAAGLDRADGHQPMYGHVIARNMEIYRSALPAGWVMSSAEDMGIWLIAHLNCGCTDKGQIIPEADIEECHNVAVTFVENGSETGYGMGWLISCGGSDVSLIWHGGDTPNFTTDMILLPDYDMGMAVLVNSQASTIGHSIAPGIANLLLGLELEPMVVPWWAHWKTIDTIATAALVFVYMLLIGLAYYIWRIWQQFHTGERRFVKSPFAVNTIPSWQLMLYSAPLVLLILIFISCYLVVNTLYGYNFFEVLVMFHIAAPPGVYITGITVLILVPIWALLLAFVGLFTRSSKATG
ncbi:MAG TPA: beta-lactamase family protein [Dehalococcoidia bacterium]|nr:beta-lactamase family protein [Dehalococcoidia bacterium]